MLAQQPHNEVGTLSEGAELAGDPVGDALVDLAF